MQSTSVRIAAEVRAPATKASGWIELVCAEIFIQALDRGFIVAGLIDNSDFLLLKVNEGGVLEWKKS